MTDNNLPDRKTTSPVARLKNIMDSPTVKEQFRNCLQEGSPLFVSSLIDLYSSDKYLQECEPGAVVMEALKAATLKLPINKSLGFAYVIAYKKIPQFQLGYKGIIQLAMRTGQYRFINADAVCEGELTSYNKMTGELVLGEATSEKVIGYFAFIETVNGFQKAIYWNLDKIEKHAKRFSESYKSKKDWVVKNSPWTTDFDAMATKTLLKHLLGKYGIMSIEMASGFEADHQANPQEEIDFRGNTKRLEFAEEESGVINGNVADTPEMTAEEKAQIEADEIEATKQEADPY